MKPFLCLSLFVFVFNCISTVSEAQLYINEFCASNSSITIDPDNKDDADWIELYNADNKAINLNNYYLTDDLQKPDKWRIPVTYLSILYPVCDSKAMLLYLDQHLCSCVTAILFPLLMYILIKYYLINNSFT
jgi:hypothetical protein